MKKPLSAMVACACVAVWTSGARADTLIDFDAVDASGGSVFGAPLDTYLSAYGVSLVSGTPGLTLAVQDERVIYGGGIVLAPSSYSVLSSFGPSNAVSFRLDFLDGLSSVSFARAGLHSATHPEWSATAFGDGGAVLGSVSEGRLSGDHAAKTFTLSGGIIRSVRFDANAQGTAGFATPLLDDLVLTPVPEPSTYALMAVGVVALASGVRVRRRRDGSEVRG